jgi:AraC-like DNA-binding protein
MLRAHIERLAGPECSMAEGELLTENVCNLAALLTARSDVEHKASCDHFSEVERMRIFMRRHLSEPTLSPQALADHMHLSVRTVHKRFEAAETTFGRSLLEERLEACRSALTDPRCRAMTASQIAFAFGFNDLSHFTKAFRARYGLPPGRYRRSAVRGATGP